MDFVFMTKCRSIFPPRSCRRFRPALARPSDKPLTFQLFPITHRGASWCIVAQGLNILVDAGVKTLVWCLYGSGLPASSVGGQRCRKRR